MNTHHRLIVGWFSPACLLGAHFACAQQVQILMTVEGLVNGENLGRSGVASIGDADGDGVGDFVGTYDGTVLLPLSGLRAFSGATGLLLWSTPIITLDLESGGDVDGDGVGDLSAGSGGSVRIVSGRTGGVVHVHLGSGTGMYLGPAGAIIGDANGDGFDDYLICEATPQMQGQGIVRVMSGRTGSVLRALPGPGSLLGGWSARLGDLDGDGYEEFGVSEQACTSSGGSGLCAGSIAVYSGGSGAILYRIVGDTPGYGLSFWGRPCGGDDLNGDGINDFLTRGYWPPGLVRAHSGVDGSTLWQIVATGNTQVGYSLGIGDDWNGDGACDALIMTGSPSQMRIVSGLNGSTLATFTSAVGPLPGGPALGLHQEPFEDVNGDGGRELLSSGAVLSPAGFSKGAIFVASWAQGSLSYRRNVGRACPAANGYMPRMSMFRDPTLGSQAAIRLRGTVPGSVAVLALGVALPVGTSFEWVPGCHLRINPLLVNLVGATDGGGMLGVDMPVPAASALAGLQLGMQWFVLDGAANQSGVIGTAALEVRLGN